MYSAAEENYLKALFTLANKKGEVSPNDLSKRLGTKMPTVNSMMKKLAEKKLVHYESYKPLKLTETGQKDAALILRKHRLTEMFLVEKMGFGWENVHEIAEQIEHIKSSIFFDKMDELLGYPKFDPHGSPIPDKNGRINAPEYISLSECNVDDTVKFMAISDSSESFLKFLNSKNMQLGQLFKILSVEKFDGTMNLKFENGTEETLSNIVCEKMLVTRIKKK